MTSVRLYHPPVLVAVTVTGGPHRPARVMTPDEARHPLTALAPKRRLSLAKAAVRRPDLKASVTMAAVPPKVLVMAAGKPYHPIAVTTTAEPCRPVKVSVGVVALLPDLPVMMTSERLYHPG